MVKVAVAGKNWTRRVEIVQEAAKERVVALGDDTISQEAMGDRLQALASQMGAGSFSCADAASTPTKSSSKAFEDLQAPPSATPKAKAVAKKASADDDDEDEGLDAFGSLVPRSSSAASSASARPVQVDSQPSRQAPAPAVAEPLAKQKGKAKPKAGAKAAASGKKGRPPENGFLKLKAALGKLEEADEVSGTSYLSASIWSSSTSRNWSNWIKSLQTEIEFAEPTTLPLLKQVERAALTVSKVLAAYHKHGSGSLKTVEIYKQELQWLRLGEHHDARNPFPQVLRRSMLSTAQLHALPGRFWASMAAAALVEADIAGPHDVVCLSVLHDRLMGIFEVETFADLRSPLVEFLSQRGQLQRQEQETEIHIVSGHLVALTSEAFSETSLVADLESDDASRLLRLKNALESTAKMLEDFRSVSPIFRALEKQAGKARSMLLARQSKQDVARDHVKDGKLASSKAVEEIEVQLLTVHLCGSCACDFLADFLFVIAMCVVLCCCLRPW